ncbi:uncharacterized protein KD926_006833 [Aspergillus affinis]|uniref:uncharacterized protein n=1 Tax=Aspergillus affinis TaxID=1070780 RepID=UPI0022FED63F|nr:uncharacterized protein KD926_006833 [Aspergillus affinis]KAI9041437.1 hypothetical protein KD926_006833 [Aspergillus affinis]
MAGRRGSTRGRGRGRGHGRGRGAGTTAGSKRPRFEDDSENEAVTPRPTYKGNAPLLVFLFVRRQFWIDIDGKTKKFQAMRSAPPDMPKWNKPAMPQTPVGMTFDLEHKEITTRGKDNVLALVRQAYTRVSLSPRLQAPYHRFIDSGGATIASESFCLDEDYKSKTFLLSTMPSSRMARKWRNGEKLVPRGRRNVLKRNGKQATLLSFARHFRAIYLRFAQMLRNDAATREFLGKSKDLTVSKFCKKLNILNADELHTKGWLHADGNRSLGNMIRVDFDQTKFPWGVSFAKLVEVLRADWDDRSGSLAPKFKVTPKLIYSKEARACLVRIEETYFASPNLINKDLLDWPLDEWGPLVSKLYNKVIAGSESVL